MISFTKDGEIEARGLHYSHALCLTVRVIGSFKSRVLEIIKRYADLLETKLVAIGLDPALMARGPTAAVLGLGVSALLHILHRMAPS